MVVADLVVSDSKNDVPWHLNAAILEIGRSAIEKRGAFTVALSGGSLASFLGSLKETSDSTGFDPKFGNWHIILADERCVPLTDPESNLGSLRQQFLDKVSVPRSQIHGIDESKLDDSAEQVAFTYEESVKKVLGVSDGQLDLAVLGFGPDGHTCSLFPNHPLLFENEKLVASIEDSPKPPPKRITLTFPVLNAMTRHVIFCGAGASKCAILQKVFGSVHENNYNRFSSARSYTVDLSDPPPYPCAMVRPNSVGTANTLTWIVDAEAVCDMTLPNSSAL